MTTFVIITAGKKSQAKYKNQCQLAKLLTMWYEIFAGLVFAHLAIFHVWQELIFAIRIDWFFLLGISFCNFQKVPSTAVCVPYMKLIFHCTPLCF